MDKRLWLNLSLAALVAILAVFVYLHRDQPQSPPLPKLTDLQDNKVQSITLSRQGEADIVLQRRGNEWWMVHPLQVPANQPRIDKLLTVLSQDSYGNFVASDMDLASLGLKPPQVSIRFNQLRIDFGGTEALNKRRYVLIDGRVQLIDDDNYYSVIAQLKHYISLHLLSAGEHLVSLSLPGLRLHKVGQGWRLDSGQTPQSGDDLMRLVQTWQSASALEVEPGKLSRAKGQPVIQLGLEGNNPAVRLAILERKPDLILLRLDNQLKFTFTSHQAQQMLQLSPDEH